MKHGANRRSVSSKTFVVMLALVLALGCAVGGTIAWLTANTDPVVNTFTYGDINIELKETTQNPYKIIPGQKIDKNPTVTVTANSEDCWLFVKVEEKDWPDFKDGSDRKVSYAIAEGWQPVDGQPNVYWREVKNTDNPRVFPVLADNQVTVSNTLTKGEIETVKDKTPTLTFTAYAIQKEGTGDAAAAWAKIGA